MWGIGDVFLIKKWKQIIREQNSDSTSGETNKQTKQKETINRRIG